MDQERIDKADTAFTAYCAVSKGSDHQSDDENLTDLLTDLRHWAVVHGEDFDRSVRLSEMNFDAEQDNDADRLYNTEDFPR